MVEKAKQKLLEAAIEELKKQAEEIKKEKVKVIKGRTEYITQYLDREVIKNQEIIKYIEQCPVPQELIDIHNKAAIMNKEQK